MLQSIRSKKETISSADATISLNIFFLMAVQLLIMILQNYCLENNSDLQLWSQICTGFIIFNLLLQTITFYYLRRIISLGYFFILCSYLVGCSFCVLIAFNLQQFDSAFFIVHLPDHGVNAFIEATRYSLNCICSLFVGYLIVSLVKFHSPESKSATKSNKYFETCKLIGIIFSIVFGLIYIVTTSLLVFSSMQSGSYSVMSTADDSPFISEALNMHPFFFSGLFLLMVYYKKNNRLDVSRKIMLFAIACIVFSFFSGVRSRGTMQLLILIILWVYCIEKPNFRTIIICIIIGLIMLQLMAAIRAVRGNDLSFYSIAHAFFSLENSIFYEVLNEYGNSLFATSALMNYSNETHFFDFFVYQLGSVLPGVSSWGGDSFVVPTVKTGVEAAYHLGSTYTADSYYYFGYFGQYLLLLLGVLIALLDKFLKNRALSASYLMIAATMPGILTIFNSVRANLNLGIKIFLYSAILFSVMYLIFMRPKTRSNNNR